MGVFAQEVLAVMPKAVSRDEDNYLRVDYANRLCAVVWQFSSDGMPLIADVVA